MNKRLWHYTIGQRLIPILESGVIKQATAFISEDEKPVVWFSTNPVWEKTCNKLKQTNHGFISLSKEETMRLGGGLIRIEVRSEAAPYDWNDYVRLSGVDSEIANRLLVKARQSGARAHEWRVSFEPVKTDNWLDIEEWIPERKIWSSVTSHFLSESNSHNNTETRQIDWEQLLNKLKIEQG